jgi:hypothetical protein
MYLADKFGDRWYLLAAVVLPILLVIIMVALFGLMAPTGG